MSDSSPARRRKIEPNDRRSRLPLLPNELILEIFCYLPLKNGHVNLACACKRFYEISKNEIIWRLLALDLVRLDAVKFPPLKDVDMSDIPPVALGQLPPVLEHLYSVHSQNWKSVVRSFGKESSLWAPLGKMSFHPLVTRGDSASTTCSKICGTPFIPVGEEWPKSDWNGSEMEFWFQISTAEGDPGHVAAHILGQDAMLQFFAFQGNPVVRVLHSVSEKTPTSKADLRQIVSRTEPFKPRTIASFEPFVDYPRTTEAGPVIDRVLETVYGKNWSRYDDGIREHENEWTAEEKLLGWADFVQGDDTPTCSGCKKRMRMIFQIVSNCMFDYMWGDCGSVHLFYCPHCPGDKCEVTFACC